MLSHRCFFPQFIWYYSSFLHFYVFTWLPQTNKNESFHISKITYNTRRKCEKLRSSFIHNVILFSGNKELINERIYLSVYSPTFWRISPELRNSACRYSKLCPVALSRDFSRTGFRFPKIKFYAFSYWPFWNISFHFFFGKCRINSIFTAQNRINDKFSDKVFLKSIT